MLRLGILLYGFGYAAFFPQTPARVWHQVEQDKIKTKGLAQLLHLRIDFRNQNQSFSTLYDSSKVCKIKVSDMLASLRLFLNK